MVVEELTIGKKNLYTMQKRITPKGVNGLKKGSYHKRINSSSEEQTCYKCGHKMQETTKLIIQDGRTFPLPVLKCTECGQASSTLKDYECVRSSLFPLFLGRIKNLFKQDHKVRTVDILKGKIL